MPDALTTGAERLATHLKDEGLPVDMTDCWGEFIAADPGVKALVEFASTFTDIKELEIATLNGYAKEVLRKWKHGDA